MRIYRTERDDAKGWLLLTIEAEATRIARLGQYLDPYTPDDERRHWQYVEGFKAIAEAVALMPLNHELFRVLAEVQTKGGKKWAQREAWAVFDLCFNASEDLAEGMTADKIEAAVVEALSKAAAGFIAEALLKKVARRQKRRAA